MGGLLKNKKTMTQSCSQGDSRAVDFHSPAIQQKHVQSNIKENTFKNIKTPGFNMVTKMFHVSPLLMPKKKGGGGGSRGVEGGEREREEGSVFTFAINLGH